MAVMKRFRNALRGWRRLFSQNWALFKASKIGLIGLAIMITFVMIALLAPFMGLRDPLWWRAPDSDIVQVTKFWPNAANNSRQFGGTPMNHSAAVRVVPKQLGVATDQIYLATGSRLYAIEEVQGKNVWTYPIDFRELTFPSPPDRDPNPVISADPVVDNFGRIDLASRAWFWVYVGTSSGSVYAINVTVKSDLTPQPERLGVVNGTITGIAVFSGDDYETYSPYDMVAVSTSSGSVYFWQVNESGHFGPKEFKVSLKPVRIAGLPMHGTGPYPLFSPAFYYTSTNKTRPYIYVGSEDGNLTALNIANLSRPITVAWTVRVAGDGNWSSAPVVHSVSLNQTERAVVFAATDEGTLTAVYATDGNYTPQFARSRYIGRTALQVDMGKLTQPFFAPTTTNLFVGSSSGYAYSINYVQKSDTTKPLQVNWYFRDTTCPEGKSYISAHPIVHTGTLVYVASNCDMGPIGRSGDVGTIFALNYGDGSLSWSVTFDAPLGSPTFAITGQEKGLDELFVGTMSGSEFAWSTSGLYLIPAPPSWIKHYPSGNTYLMGLDNRGRDIFSQWVWGSRIALYVGFMAAAFAISIGTTMGLVAGYFGGKIETVLMRFTDVILVIPSLPLIITLAAVLGSSVNNLILVIAIVGWPGTARVIRSQVISLKERPFIESAKVTGASHARIMARHILPNVLPLAFLFMTFAVSGAILSEAALSFIGLGDINTMSWGRMLQDVSQSQALTAWWWLLPPGIAITLISLSFFLIGRAFDEIVNPRLRKR